MSQRKSREEIERHLKAAGESINRRISTIEKTVRPPALDKGLEAGRKIAGSPVARGGLLFGVGFLAGWWVGGSGKGRRKEAPVAGSGLLGALLATVAREAAQTLAKGLLSEFSRRRGNRDSG